MRLPDELLNIVVRFAWLVPREWTTTGRHLTDQLDCALDCQRNIPPWFLCDVEYTNLDTSMPILPFSRIKSFNPLVLGASFSPFNPAKVRLNRRSVSWLFNSIGMRYLRRKKMLRKPLFRMLEEPALNVWNKLLDKIGDLTLKDICPKGYMVILLSTVMTAHLPFAGRGGNWQKRFLL